jgi:hypothetical protein
MIFPPRSWLFWIKAQTLISVHHVIIYLKMTSTFQIQKIIPISLASATLFLIHERTEFYFRRRLMKSGKWPRSLKLWLPLSLSRWLNNLSWISTKHFSMFQSTQHPWSELLPTWLKARELQSLICSTVWCFHLVMMPLCVLQKILVNWWVQPKDDRPRITSLTKPTRNRSLLSLRRWIN